jgi:outer membrane protein TolC
VGASFVWNIFDGLQRERKIKQSKIDVAISNNQYTEAQKQLTTAIHKAYYELENAKESINTLGSTIAMTDELIRIRQAAYKEGMATTTEVIDAQTANAKAKLMLMAEYYRYDMMLATLVALCGIPQYFQEWSTQQ